MNIMGDTPYFLGETLHVPYTTMKELQRLLRDYDRLRLDLGGCIGDLLVVHFGRERV